MDWSMFWGGIMMFGLAFMNWALIRWGYNKDDDFDRMKRTVNWFGVIAFSLVGLVIILFSFVAKA